MPTLAFGSSTQLLVVLLAIISMVSGAFSAIYLGQDANWDLLNYHYYVPYAFLNGRMNVDGAPASLLTYVHPVAFLPYYLLTSYLPPMIASSIMGALHCLIFVLSGLLCWFAAAGLKLAMRVTMAAVGTVFSAISPLTISEIGTSLVDGITGIFVLASLALLIAADGAERHRHLILAFAASAVAIAVSLKLTNAIYIIGFVVAAMCGTRGLSPRFRDLQWVVAGGLVGFVLSGGLWYAYVWVSYGNPFYPFYNAIFKAKGFPEYSFYDAQHLPKGLTDAAVYPLEWALGRPRAELPFADARYAVLLYGLLPLYLAVIVFRQLKGSQVIPACVSRPRTRILVFLVVSYAAWLSMFAISRYAIPIEVLLGAAFVSVLLTILPQILALAGLLICATVALATFQPISWGRTDWSTSNWFDLQFPPDVSKASAIFLGPHPIGYVAPYLPRDVPIFGLGGWFDLSREVAEPFGDRIQRALVAADGRPAFLITSTIPIWRVRKALASHELAFSGSCSEIHGRVEKLTLCTLVRSPSQNRASVELREGQRVPLGRPGNAAALLWGDWAGPEDWGTWAIAGARTSGLTFRPSTDMIGPLIVELDAVALVGGARASTEIIVTNAAGREHNRFRFEAGAPESPKRVCLPRKLDQPVFPVTLIFRQEQPTSAAELGIGLDNRKVTIGLRALTVRRAPGGTC